MLNLTKLVRNNLIKLKTIGENIRHLRESRGLLLRHVAAQLDVDASFLSKVERGDKRPTRAQVILLAKILEVSESSLLIEYLSDKVALELKGELLAKKAIQVAEKKLEYLNKEQNGKI